MQSTYRCQIIVDVIFFQEIIHFFSSSLPGVKIICMQLFFQYIFSIYEITYMKSFCLLLSIAFFYQFLSTDKNPSKSHQQETFQEDVQFKCLGECTLHEVFNKPKGHQLACVCSLLQNTWVGRLNVYKKLTCIFTTELLHKLTKIIFTKLSF